MFDAFKNRLPRTSILYCCVGSLVLVALVFLARDFTYRTIHKSERTAFERSCSILSKEILSYVYGLQGIAGIVHTHNYEPSFSQVRGYARNRDFFRNFGGALGFGFIRFVPRGELSAYLEKVRQQKPDFSLKSLSNYSGDHFIIESIEPSELNGIAQGLDVATESHRRTAALRSRDSRESTLTAPLKLYQAKSVGMGFLFFHPIFDTSASKARFVGWSYAPILMDQLMKSLKLTADERLEFSMTDVTEANRPLEIFSSDGIKRNKVETEYFSRLKIAGRVWEIRGGIANQSYHLIIDALSVAIFFALTFIFGSLVLFIEDQAKKRNDSNKKLGEVESWQKAILDSAGYSIISTDTNGLIQTFNLGAQDLLGYASHEVVGKTDPSPFHDPREVARRAEELSLELGRIVPPGFSVFVEKAKELGTSDTQEWTYVRKDGTTFPVRLCVTAIRSQDQQIVGFLGIAEDISKLKELESLVELQRVSLFSTAKMSALGEMAGGIAHEINNPLAILDSRISLLLLRSKAQQIESSWLEQELLKLQMTIVRIAKIISGLRSFSREGTKDPKTDVRVGDIIDGTLDLCRERFSNHGIQISLRGDMAVTISCRAVQISQVLMNLFNNSFDAIHDLDEKWISIDVQTSSNATKIVVTDSGLGIEEETIKKMMEPFFTTKELGKGTGLGLSISAGIMAAHAGNLRYNKMSSNTQFILEFTHA